MNPKRSTFLLGCVLFLSSSLPRVADVAQAAPRAATRTVEAYAGTIVAGKDRQLVLRDNDDDVYYLDNQEDAAKFVGKKVWVMGRLDPRTETIHVDEIEEAR
ncbi:MAG TPA: DUF5818 domain-containing protein [Candidatus Aquilonibacter sp.]|nr:DUF5818 domain-containing protein [Candidatus Aquilonibacter sp.]